MKTTLSALVFLAASASIQAMDVSPFKPGQELDAGQARQLQQRFRERKQQPWKEPDGDGIDGQPDAGLIRYGIQLLDNTAATIGPGVADAGMRYSGNALNCSNCHLKGPSGLPGSKYQGSPFVNLANDYPQFRARSMSVGTIQDRVNGCMTRSMGAGKPLPDESREMQAIVAYFNWLASGTEEGQGMQGTGLPDIAFPQRKADIDQGKQGFTALCAPCHGLDARGLKLPDGSYQFPPLAGEDSFNNGAGMSRLKTAARFIYGNMPLGADARKPTLSAEQAYDIAAYVLSLPRPHRSGREKDFPDPAFRPDDYPVPEWFEGNTAGLEKATLGPFEQ